MVPATTALTATRRLIVSGRAIFSQTCAAAACTFSIDCRTLTALKQVSLLSGLGTACLCITQVSSFLSQTRIRPHGQNWPWVTCLVTGLAGKQANEAFYRQKMLKSQKKEESPTEKQTVYYFTDLIFLFSVLKPSTGLALLIGCDCGSSVITACGFLPAKFHI
jgi:hypothetical protein